MNKKTVVKLVVRGGPVSDNSPWMQQCPNDDRIYGDCEFVFNALAKDYDWLVIIDDIKKVVPNKTEALSCPRENTILVTTEPSTIARYGKAFSGQFGYLITNQDEKILPHKNAIRSQSGNIWYYGKKYSDIVKDTSNKTKLISTVCSSKQQGHTYHRMRFDFTALLEKEIPELERFGHGVKWIDHKYDALDPYKFHVAIENHMAVNMWTEKLADSFLGYTVPIYCGCTNVSDYFPEDSFIQIDLNDFAGSIKKIKEVISKEGEYERRLPAVKEARRRVMEEYNLLAMIDKIIKESDQTKVSKVGGQIHGRRVMRFKYPPDLIKYVWFRISNFIKVKL